MLIALVMSLLLQAEPSGATAALQARDRMLRSLLPPAGTPLAPEQQDRVERAATQMVDLPGMARAALGKHWTAQSAEERRRFLRVFEVRFRHAAAEQLDFYRSAKTVFGAERRSPGGVVVPVDMDVEGEPTHVEYLMRKVRGAWRIEDIVVDGVSTVADYRSAFAKIISDQGFGALVAKLSGPAPKSGTGGSGTQPDAAHGSGASPSP